MFRQVARVLSILILLGAMPISIGCRPGLSSSGGGTTPSDLNIVLILVDALRADHVGLYGYEKPTTPFLDRLGERGVVFEHACSQASQTFPSCSSLLTSRYFPYLVTNDHFKPVGGVSRSTQQKLAKVKFVADENLTLAEVMKGATASSRGFL